MPAEFVRLLQAGCEVKVLATTQRDFFLQKFASLDPLVVAAWQIYELEQNKHDFFDTLLRIYRQETNTGVFNREKAAAQAAPSKPPRPAADASTSMSEEEADQGTETLLAILDQCIELMIKRESIMGEGEGGKVTTESVAALRLMAKEKDPHMIMVLSQFSETRDVDRLLADLELIGDARVKGLIGGADGGPAVAPPIPTDAEYAEYAAMGQTQPQEPEKEAALNPSAADGITELDQMTIIIEAMWQESIVSNQEHEVLKILVRVTGVCGF